MERVCSGIGVSNIYESLCDEENILKRPGNLALKVLATGGVYWAGGIALHLVKLLQKQQFVQTFTRKGRFKDLMERMPIHIITARVALLGAATFGP